MLDFLHPFLDLVSVSNIYDKRNVHAYIGVNHVIIAFNIYRWMIYFGYYSRIGE